MKEYMLKTHIGFPTCPQVL